MTPSRPDEGVLAAEPLDADDDRALSLLRTHWTLADPVPTDLAERVKFAMTVASLEAEVAHLMSNSAEVGAMRTTEYDRATTVTFESEGMSIMVTLEESDRGLMLLRGWVTATGAEVELRERSRSRTTTADDDGRFVFEGVERGTVHLVIRDHDEPGSRPVITPGIEI
ncbi:MULTISPECIES: hypothetical protein [unclassified Knoellia]|uniref:hypothetical protein n=1 Tax=Knoellia altitudinis TaxID=3404795 RepID=UPI00361A5E15